ncbi:MAG: hypothetical protein HYY16_11590 [Planctomycetes bacterium]|nr:hypothetical protein [Planctomycetota bacterium]
MTRGRTSIAAFVLLLFGVAALIYPRSGQLRRLARLPGTSERTRWELAAWLGDSSAPEVARGPVVASLLQVARALYEKGEHRESLRVLSRVVEHPDARSDEVIAAVRMALWMNRPDVAARFCDQFIAWFGVPRHASHLELAARAYADNGEPAKAADAWLAMYEITQDETDRRRALAAAAALHPFEPVPAAHERHLESWPEDLEVRERLARLYQGRDRQEAFLEQLEELLRRDPNRDELRCELVWGQAARGQYARVIPHLEILRARGRETASLRDLYLESLLVSGMADRDIRALIVGMQRAFNERQCDLCVTFGAKIVAHRDATAADTFRAAQFALWLQDLPGAARLCDALRVRFGIPGERGTMRGMAQIYADHKEFAKAAEIWASIYDGLPDGEERRQALTSLAALEPGTRAIERHRDYLTRHDDDLEVRERLARLYQANQQLQPYIAELEQLLERMPESDALERELVWACAAGRDYERSIPHLEGLRRRGKDHADDRELYLTALDETGRIEQLVAEIGRLLKDPEEDADLLRRLAEGYESQQRLDRAAEIWAALFDLWHDERALGERAAALFEFLGRWDDARRIYRELRERFPADGGIASKLLELHDVEVERELMQLSFDRKDYPEAIRAGLDFLGHAPGDPTVLRIVADSFHSLPDIPSARKYYVMLASVAPDDAECVYKIAACSSAMGDEQEARVHALRALALIERQPVTHAAKLTQALSLILLKREQEARSLILELLARVPQDPGLLSTFAWALMELKEYEKLYELLARWRALEPDSIDLRHIWAQALIHDGRLEEAAAVLAERPGEKLPTLLLGQYLEVLSSLGRWSEVQRLLQEREPDNASFDWLREQIRATYGPEGALAASLFSARREDHLRTRESFRCFVTERAWVGEVVEQASLRGRVASLGADERVELLSGGLTAGYQGSGGLQTFVTLGGWDGVGAEHFWGKVGVDWTKTEWSLSLDAEFDRPWDALVEAAAFDGVLRRGAASGWAVAGPAFLYGALRLSRFRLEDAALDGERADEKGFFARGEYRLYTGTTTLRAGFFDETLRWERVPVTHFALVAQTSAASFEGSEKLLAVIPLIESSAAMHVGVAGLWVLNQATAVGAEVLVGQDRPRELGPGELYGGTLRLIHEWGNRSRWMGEMTYSNEQFKAGGSDSWLLQMSWNLNF